MEQQLKLTARGQAVCELMADLGLTLEAACDRVERELDALRLKLDGILRESDWEDMPAAIQAALDGVSVRLQDAYLEESMHAREGALVQHASWQDEARIH